MIFTQREDPYKKVIEQFLHYCHTKTYPPKHVVFRPGDMGDRLYYIVDGSVSISVEDDDDQGQELVLAYWNKHDFIGTVGIFKGSEMRKVTVMTRTKCHMAEMSYDRFQHSSA